MDKLSVKTPENRAMWEHIANEREKNDADSLPAPLAARARRRLAPAAGGLDGKEARHKHSTSPTVHDPSGRHSTL